MRALWSVLVLTSCGDAAPDAAPPPVPLTWAWVPLAFDVRATAQVPVGWTESVDDEWTAPAELEPSGIEIRRHNVDAVADPWPQLEAKSWIVPRAGGTHEREIVRDEPFAGGRVVVSQTFGGPPDKIDVFHWREGGEVVFHCHVYLTSRLAAQLDEFERACRELRVETFEDPGKYSRWFRR